MSSKPFLQEIWIIDAGGIVLYHQSLESRIDPVLFGGIITALNKVGEQIFKDYFQSIQIGQYKYSIIHCSQTDLLFIGLSNKDTKDEHVRKYLEKIHALFLQKYCGILTSWTGNLEIFKDLDQVISLKNDAENWLGINLTKDLSRKVINQL